ncbi:hypothetical protein TNCT_475371 [Trichonephila clavata]|uniref:MBD domain-containing protein n=1 Tax=Trichonephila clavata TaxID=2740835 RepID=A0A8X6HDT7_TRICU|nr:hypothetical protein TNCT_475371 [Trichonephila clavata]
MEKDASPPTRQRQSRNTNVAPTPNQRNNFHHRDDSRHERIVKDASDKSSVATSESSEDETDEDSPDTHKPSTKTVNWFRKLVPRQMVAVTDVYYYQEGCTKRLRTLKDIEKYCKDHNLTFDSDIFNFSQSDPFTGL